MKFEEALEKVIAMFDSVAVDKETFKDADVVMAKAIELMKADAMQRQADAVEKIANALVGCTEATSFSGQGRISVGVEIKK